MYGFNKVILFGRAPADGTLINAETGKEVGKFNLLEADNLQSKPMGHSITCFGKLALFCAKWIKKGNPYLVDGSIKYTKYFDKKLFAEVYRTEIIASNIRFSIPAVAQVEEFDALTMIEAEEAKEKLFKQLNEGEI